MVIYTRCTSVKCSYLFFFIFFYMLNSEGYIALYSKYAPSLILHSPHLSGNFVNSTPVKIFLFCCKPFNETFFSNLCTKQSVAQQVWDPSMQTSGNQKAPSLVSKPYGVEVPS